MKTWFVIWIIGYLLSLAYGTKVISKNDNNMVELGEFLFLLILSIFSWIAFICLIIGNSIKNGKDNDDHNRPSINGI